MKFQSFLIIAACLLCSCSEEKASSARPAKQSGDPKAQVVPLSESKPQISPPGNYSPGDSVPPMETLGEGKFLDKGLADAFQYAVGSPMPDYVTPVEGAYKVWNEKDYGGRNRAGYGAYYVVSPERAILLADAIEKAWRDKHGGNQDIEISRSVCEKTYAAGDKTIHAGTIGLGLNEKYASYTMLKFTMSFDPVSGEVSLTSYRGTEDTPAEREKPDGQ